MGDDRDDDEEEVVAIEVPMEMEEDDEEAEAEEADDDEAEYEVWLPIVALLDSMIEAYFGYSIRSCSFSAFSLAAKRSWNVSTWDKTPG